MILKTIYWTYYVNIYFASEELQNVSMIEFIYLQTWLFCRKFFQYLIFPAWSPKCIGIYKTEIALNTSDLKHHETNYRICIRIYQRTLVFKHTSNRKIMDRRIRFKSFTDRQKKKPGKLGHSYHSNVTCPNIPLYTIDWSKRSRTGAIKLILFKIELSNFAYFLPAQFDTW